jgi:hypothetical protein
LNEFPGPNGQGDADQALGNLEIADSQAAIEVARRAFAPCTAIANDAASRERAMIVARRSKLVDATRSTVDTQ